MKYSITLASFRNIEPIEKTLSKLSSQGYDAVEMFGEPSEVNIPELVDLLSVHRMPVCGITGMWGNVSRQGLKRKLLSTDPAVIKSTAKYVQDCIRMCNSLSGKEVNICLLADHDRYEPDRTHTVISLEEKARVTKRALPAIRRLCKVAADNGVDLLLEPLNRYSTPYCTTARDAVDIIREANCDCFGVLLDTFHMNIEEDTFRDAIQISRDFLKHAHFADNNRKMPGLGHIDFRSILQSLKDIAYDGYVTFEPNIQDQHYGQQTKDGLEFVRMIGIR